MIGLVIFVQIALPLAMLLWLALLPAGNLVGFIFQAIGIGVFLFALARVSQWAVPVWWLPWVYGVLWLATILAYAARNGLSVRPLIPVDGWDRKLRVRVNNNNLL